MKSVQPGPGGYSVFLRRPVIKYILAGVLIVIMLAGIANCLSLPDMKQEMAVPQEQQIDFEGPRGPVSAAKSDDIIDVLEGNGETSDLLQKHLAYEQKVNVDSPLVLGNKLTLLQNGPATYEAMFTAIHGATSHINLETYIFNDDKIGQQFSDLLLEKQAAGVQVNIIYDSFGGLLTPTSFFDNLRDGGIRVLEFNPMDPLTDDGKEWLPNNRDHRKQLIVDGRIAFVGGINISNTYSSTPRPGKKQKKAPNYTDGWRDTHMQIEGPVVAEFQKLFLDTWVRQEGEALTEQTYFPELKAEGDEIVRAIGSSSTDADSLIYQTLISAISNAELKVHMTIAYFAPDPQLLNAIIDAARRGVEVKLILPSYTDSWAIFHLGRSYYTKLLRGGVKIYERQGALMHTKAVSIDDVWSIIGSTNMDWRSFLHNDEINAVILGHDFAAQMEAMFTEDLMSSEAILLKQWKKRSILKRLKEYMAQIGAYWL